MRSRDASVWLLGQQRRRVGGAGLASLPRPRARDAARGRARHGGCRCASRPRAPPRPLRLPRPRAHRRPRGRRGAPGHHGHRGAPGASRPDAARAVAWRAAMGERTRSSAGPGAATAAIAAPLSRAGRARPGLFLCLLASQRVPGDGRSMVIMRAKGEVAARDDPCRYVLQGAWRRRSAYGRHPAGRCISPRRTASLGSARCSAVYDVFELRQTTPWGPAEPVATRLLFVGIGVDGSVLRTSLVQYLAAHGGGEPK